jgi:hypothetical protein
MIKHNIILVECNPLYQILFEIKNNFLFEMKNFILKDLNKADLTSSIILTGVSEEMWYVAPILPWMATL